MDAGKTHGTGAMILRTNHTSFTVSDIDRSIAFYRDQLGLEFLRVDVRDPTFSQKASGIPGAVFKVAFLQAPDHRLELIEYKSPPGRKLDLATNNVGCAHIAFEVDDLRGMYARLKAAGVVFASEPLQIQGGPNDGGWMVYLRDPDGITVELQEFPDRRYG
jgi:catechol 2,3-dioxygenase-like lactoylglutathione lyase family enzyme